MRNPQCSPLPLDSRTLGTDLPNHLPQSNYAPDCFCSQRQEKLAKLPKFNGIVAVEALQSILEAFGDRTNPHEGCLTLLEDLLLEPSGHIFMYCFVFLVVWWIWDDFICFYMLLECFTCFYYVWTPFLTLLVRQLAASG